MRPKAPAAPRSVPVAMTIAGSDSGGGAGIQADLKTFAACGVFGTSAITCITAQNPIRVKRWDPLPPSLVQDQMESILCAFPIKAVKTGMTGNDAIVRRIVRLMKKHRDISWVVDPILHATTGTTLLRAVNVVRAIKPLLHHATLVTPNIAEAEALTGRPITNRVEACDASTRIFETWGAPCLLKGGHLPRQKTVMDFFSSDRGTVALESPRIAVPDLHGTGCTLSAAITASLAKGTALLAAIEEGREYLRRAMTTHVRTGRHSALGWD